MTGFIEVADVPGKQRGIDDCRCSGFGIVKVLQHGPVEIRPFPDLLSPDRNQPLFSNWQGPTVIASYFHDEMWKH